jgi:hypothetical protein
MEISLECHDFDMSDSRAASHAASLSTQQMGPVVLQLVD